ncbi:hypothetical protein Tco_0691999, partial [Tanacetum coccineum]
ASNCRYAHIGDVIVAVIKDAVPNTDCMSARIPPERLPLLIGHELNQNHSQRVHKE